jgi:sugar/nucleoside kinase (ribokinase family)
MNKRVGLIGTITRDVISSDSGMTHEDLGGIFYQAAALSGLNTGISLYSNIGEDLALRVDRILREWPAVDVSGMRHVPCPSNFVRLHYPEKGEREEILESVVPAIESKRVRDDLASLDMLVAVCNSGFDILLEEWRKIVHQSECPLWFDVHSLALSKVIGQPRKYIALHEWRDWLRDVTCVQANAMELSSMMGRPGKSLTHEDFSIFGAKAFEQNVKTVFVTLGREGVLVMSPAESKKLAFSDSVHVRDTTGCGDVFCAATVAKLVRGDDLFDAARFGVQLAARAAEVKGFEETYALASRYVHRS